MFTTGGGGTPTKLSQFTNDLTGSSGSWNVPGTLTASGLVTANTGVNVLGSNVLNFGSNLTKETNAGKIGYQTFDVGCLNIIGAGTSAGNRTTKFYDNVIVHNNLSFFGGGNVLTGTNIQAGTVQGRGSVTVTVTFAKPFINVPFVTATSSWSNTPQNTFVTIPQVSGVTTTGFVFWAWLLQNNQPISYSGDSFYWVAVSPTG